MQTNLWLSILISYVYDKMRDVLSGYFLHKLRLPLALVTTSITVLHAGGVIISHCNKQQDKRWGCTYTVPLVQPNKSGSRLRNHSQCDEFNIHTQALVQFVCPLCHHDFLYSVPVKEIQ